MTNPQGLSLEYSWPSGQTVTDKDVDFWELHASRRALRNLRTLLVGQPMLDLLQNQINASDAYFKEVIIKSNGQYKESRIDLTAKGITKAEFLTWWKDWMQLLSDPETKQKTFLETMVPAHPEHYAPPPYPGGIIETIGEHVARVRIQLGGELPECVRQYADENYQPLSAIGTLDYGSILFYILQEIRDVEGGCDFRFRLCFPAAAPQVFFDEHAEHLAVEFRSFITTAYRTIHRESVSVDRI